MKKTTVLFVLCLAAQIVSAAPAECPGKRVPFTLTAPIDINGDGVNEKFFMCESQKEKNKTLFRVLDGKTDKIIMSAVLDINPQKVKASLIDDPDSGSKDIEILISSRKEGPYTLLTLESRDLGMEAGGHALNPDLNFFFYNNVYAGMIETRNNDVFETGIIEHAKIRAENLLPCGKAACVLVYSVTGAHNCGAVASQTEELFSAYIMHEGKLEIFYKKDGDNAVFCSGYEDLFKGDKK